MKTPYPNQPEIKLPAELPFYKLIENLEKKKGLPEKEIVKLLGIPRSTYRSWKDGTSEPSKRHYWQALSKVFKVGLDLLISGPTAQQPERTLQ